MSITPQHIVFLTPGFAKSEKDSTTIPALQVYLKHLKKVLPETHMTLVSFQFPFSNKPYNWNGIKVIPLNGKNKRYKKLWTWKKALRALKKIHHKTPITIIHSFWIGECSLIGSRFSKKNNLNHITTVMGQDAQLGNKYVTSLSDSNTKIVTLSKNHQRILYENYNLKSSNIPWFLDTASFPALQKNTIDILGVGSLNDIKNYALFLTIITNLVKTHPNLNVEIVGEGKQQVALEKQIERLKLCNNVTLTGKLDRKQVLSKMAQANILLHTSTYESFGFVFIEGLYSGMHIVSLNVGIAKSLTNWKIGNSETELTSASISFLTQSKKEKQRVLLTQQETSMSSYLKLYNE